MLWGLGQADVLQLLRHVVVVAAVAGIVFVVSPEVGDVEVQVLGQLDARAEAERPGAGDEADVFHVVVRQAILGALHATADLYTLVHVPLDAGQVFVCAGGEQLLLVVGHVGLLVEEVVVAHRGTERGQQVVGHANGQQAGDVVRRVDAVVVGREAGGVDARVVLHIQVGVELILHADVQFLVIEVEADDGRQSPALLVAVQLLVGGCVGEQGFLGFVGHHACHGLEGIRGRHHILRTRHIDLDVAQVARIVVAHVVHATAHESREVLVDLVGDAQLHAVEELAALHVAVHVVAVDAQALTEDGEHGDDGLERGQTPVERCLTATARHGKAAREHPVALLVGRLEAGDDGSRSFALEQLGGIAAILHAVGKGREGGRYLTRLIGALDVQ